MKAKTNQPELSTAMRDAVERLYRVFDSYSTAKHPLDVCTHCCMDAELEVEMRRLPLRQLATKHFYGYNNSAKSNPQPPEELKYFLPRMLELLAAGAEIHHSMELYLQRIGNCEAGEFSTTECAAISDFAIAYFAEFLGQHQWQSGVRHLADDAFDVLLMFDIGGVDVGPLLQYWLQADTVAATLHYVNAAYYDFQCDRNAFATDRPQYQEKVKHWFIDQSHRCVFADRILKQDMSVIDQTTIFYYGSRITPKEMAETVFDLIAS